VLTSGEDEDGGAGGLTCCGVGASDCAFHSASHALVVVFRISDIGAVPCVWCVTAIGREDCVFMVERVVGVRVQRLVEGV
jgi:hypothetical protein